MNGIMNGYILTVLGVVLVSTLSTAILPDGKTATFVKSIARLACIFVVISPVFTFFQKGSNGENIFNEMVINTDGAYIDYCSKISIKNAEKALKDSVEKDFGVSCEAHVIWQYEKTNTDGFNGFFLISYEGEQIKITEIQLYFLEVVGENTKSEIVDKIKAETGCGVVSVANGK